MPTNCQTEIRETVISAVLSWPSQGAKSWGRPMVFEEPLGDAPERAQDQLPDETDDDDREHGRQEDEGAIDVAPEEPRQAQHGGQRDADDVLHRHMDGEEDQIVDQRVAELVGPDRMGQQVDEVLEPREMRDAGLVLAVEGVADGVEQGIDREERVDEGRRRQEHQDMGPGPAASRWRRLLGKTHGLAALLLRLMRRVPAGQAVFQLLGAVRRASWCR